MSEKKSHDRTSPTPWTWEGSRLVDAGGKWLGITASEGVDWMDKAAIAEAPLALVALQKFASLVEEEAGQLSRQAIRIFSRIAKQNPSR